LESGGYPKRFANTRGRFDAYPRNTYEYTEDTRINALEADNLAGSANEFGGISPRATYSPGLQAVTREFSENTGTTVKSFRVSGSNQFREVVGLVSPDNPGVIWINSAIRRLRPLSVTELAATFTS